MQMKKFLIRTAVGLVIVIGAAFGGLAFSAWQSGLSIPAQFLRVVLLPAVPMPSASDPDKLRAMIQESRATGPALPSAAFRAKFSVQESDVAGQQLWTAAPRESAGSPLRILYIPGGAYINQPLALHWDIAEQLIERTDATLVMPFYPLAPENDWQPAFEMVNTIYASLVEEVGAEHVVIMGDSSGGGIALALVQQIRDQNEPLPAAVVLFSPWLDVTLSDPDQVALDQRDFILSMDMLRIGGKWWAGDLPTTDPRISPLFGSLQGLPPIAVFTGTDDLLYPDATRLAENAKVANTCLSLFEYKNMFHVWVGVLPGIIPEAARALDEAAAFVLDTPSACDELTPASTNATAAAGPA